eukprot:TRINITY_DN32176_c0_g1_i1.p1 TRINITY_DN32176_c0_g1~~TRINITY_DN32176_c0_g1_i1.p1  ORF type:complete len:425 (+),score=50.23 TRINITY_DN32176_c0_g1_i1:94-1275(+)
MAVSGDGACRLLVSRMLMRAAMRPGAFRSEGDAAFPRNRDWACQLLVSRMLMKAAARPGLFAVTESQDSAGELPDTCTRISTFGTSGFELNSITQASRSDPTLKLSSAAEACRKLLYRCVLSSSLDAHMLASLVLGRTYRRAGQIHLQKDETILPLVHRHCGPVEWGRCSSCCRQFRRQGIQNMGLLGYWFSGFEQFARDEAIKLACQHNLRYVLRPLVAVGANVNCVFEQFWFRTPLHRAASRGNRELCEDLLALRAEPAWRDSHGATPLHLVASKGRLAIVDLLLQHNPSGVDAADFSGRTPCHMAVLKGHGSVVRHLVTARADIAAQATNGQTPMDLAQRGQFAEILEFLQLSLQRQEHAAQALPAARALLQSLFRSTYMSLSQTTLAQA